MRLLINFNHLKYNKIFILQVKGLKRSSALKDQRFMHHLDAVLLAWPMFPCRNYAPSYRIGEIHANFLDLYDTVHIRKQMCSSKCS